MVTASCSLNAACDCVPCSEGPATAINLLQAILLQELKETMELMVKLCVRVEGASSSRIACVVAKLADFSRRLVKRNCPGRTETFALFMPFASLFNLSSMGRRL